MDTRGISVRCLRFDDFAPGQDYHAALADPPRRAEALRHTHDFSEALYVLEGSGTHGINGHEQALRDGDLLWIRAADCHTFYVRPGQKLHFINIAFRESVWADFRRIALMAAEPTLWETAPQPLPVHVPPARRAECRTLFEDTLRAWQRTPTRFDLCRFWCGVLPLLAPPPPQNDRESWSGRPCPGWLRRACLEMGSEEALRTGAPLLAEKCGVSPAHLARTLKAAVGQTPTEFINGLRLEQAAILLATTPQEITEIALDCGFENLSYFYRLFGRHYGTSPRKFRQGARRAVMP